MLNKRTVFKDGLSKAHIRILLSLIFAISPIGCLSCSSEYSSETSLRLKETISLPIPLNQLDEGNGFCCTGLAFDPYSGTFLLGNTGKRRPGDDCVAPQIIRYDRTFSQVISIIRLSDYYPQMTDIQGLAVDCTDGTIWLASTSENLVRHIDADGVDLSEFVVNNPNGIAFDSSRDCLWVLTDNQLIGVDRKGFTIAEYNVEVPGQDHIVADAEKDCLLMTAGTDYSKPQYLYEINLVNGACNLLYALEGSYSVEGVALAEESLFVANDGFYHDALEPFNQICVYNALDIK